MISPLQGKKILVLGADRGCKSVDILRTCRLTGAEIFVACGTESTESLRNLLSLEDASIVSGIHFFVVPNMIKRHANVREAAASILSAVDVHMLDGCVTFQDNWVQLAADLCHFWKLPGCDPIGTAATIDKYLFRKMMTKANLSVAHCILLEDFLVGNIPDDMKYPVVLKPACGAGSQGVFLAYSVDELLKKKNDYERDHPDRFRHWIVEEFLVGPELGVELVMSNGECVFSSLMECVKTPPPVFQGVGRFYPSRLAQNLQDDLVSESIKAAKLLNLYNGVIDMDVKYVDGRGAVVLEINCRMGGFSVGFMHEVVYGLNLIEQHLRCACNIPCDVVVKAQQKSVFAKLVLADRSGMIHVSNESFEDELKKRLTEESKPYLKTARLVCTPGSSVSGGDGKIPSILAVAISEGESIGEAEYKATVVKNAAAEMLNGTIKPNPAGIFPSSCTGIGPQTCAVQTTYTDVSYVAHENRTVL